MLKNIYFCGQDFGISDPGFEMEHFISFTIKVREFQVVQ